MHCLETGVSSFEGFSDLGQCGMSIACHNKLHMSAYLICHEPVATGVGLSRGVFFANVSIPGTPRRLSRWIC